jgi:hypothetical protein
MKRRLRKNDYVRQYVLGTHDQAQQERFEERLLTDEKLLEELSIVENELVYDYLSGTLSGPERERFESRFLATAEGNRALQFFRAFKDRFDNFAPSEDRTLLRRSWKRFLPAFLRSENPALRISFVTGILILVLAGLFVLLPKWRNHRVTVFTVALEPGQTRIVGEKEMTVVEVPQGVDVVNLQLMIGEKGGQSYQASLFTDKGEEEFTQNELQAESATEKVVSVPVPAGVLIRGDYRLRLKARMPDGNVEEIASYSFRVIRR